MLIAVPALARSIFDAKKGKEGKEGQRGKDGEESLCFRLERKGKDGEARKERIVRKG